VDLPPSVRLFVATELVDGRKGPDSLMTPGRDILAHDMFEGHLFIFFTRRRDRVRIVYWVATVSRCGRRIERGRFCVGAANDARGAIRMIEAAELGLIL
jgi:transposase